jgi:hypothetical protein
MAILNAPASGVTVRMYRQGLGDCFLLAFPTDTGKPFYVLIDCGIARTLAGDHKGPTIKEVAEHVRDSTGGRIDLLVVTHAHWDHIAGFSPARGAASVFQDMQIGQVWLPWTENPRDNRATAHKKTVQKAHRALRAALNRAANPGSVQPISSVLDFLGATGDDVRAAMQVIVGLAKKDGPQYLDPAQLHKPRTLPHVQARLYVLGPPRDVLRLHHMNPGKGESYPGRGEVKTKGSALTSAQAFLIGAHVGEDQELNDEEKELRNLCYPFDHKLRIPSADAKKIDFFRTHYYGSPSEAWRRIDDAWLGVSAGLAAALDSYVNNTSLALAIELPRSGNVLVFAADAQMGNWQSWGDLTWEIDDGGNKTRTVKIQDLLEYAVFYKVGHHGSENASFLPYVDLMKRPELVAMLPVDEKDARAVHWDKMPWPPLVKHLKSEGSSESPQRVIIKMDEFPTQKPNSMSVGDWQKFKKRYEEDRFYMQYTVSD